MSVTEEEGYRQDAAARHWMVTINNPDDENNFGNQLPSTGITYAVCGQEIGEQGTPHEQCYVVFEKKIRMSSLKKIFPTAHLDKCNGTPQQCRAYCIKSDESFVESGQLPLTGAESEKQRWERTYHYAKTGQIDLIDPRIMVMYYGNIRRIQQDNPVPKDGIDGRLTHVWLWGPPGVGKSRRARELAPAAYIKSCSKWWDGYRGEEDVIIDDFEQNMHCLGHHMKVWGDRYPFQAEIKGTSVLIRPRRIIVTSNYSPDVVWTTDAQMLDAIKRRFNVEYMDTFPPTKVPGSCTYSSELNMDEFAYLMQ